MRRQSLRYQPASSPRAEPVWGCRPSSTFMYATRPKPITGLSRATTYQTTPTRHHNSRLKYARNPFRPPTTAAVMIAAR